MKSEKVSIVVSSCDKFSDLWEVFFKLLFKYWPDCPYEVWLISNELEYDDVRVKTFKVGVDRGWASNLGLALDAIKADYIIYLQEDYFIRNRVDSLLLSELLEFAKVEDCAYLRIIPVPGANKSLAHNKNVGIIEVGTKYRVSLQAAIWDTKKLSKIMVEGESGWDMEHRGSERSNETDDGYLSVFGNDFPTMKQCLPIDYFCTGVVKGKWLPGAVLLCAREGIFPDYRRRGMHGSRFHHMAIFILRFFYRFMYRIKRIFVS